MSKLILIIGALVFAASHLVAGPKCERAKEYLDAHRANLIPTFNLDNSNQKIKIVQQTGIERLGLLDRAIERNHEFLCGHALTHLQDDVEFIEKNLQ
jgi:hypothetical protein